MGNKRIIAIDGNSLINRAFYALPPLSNKDGICTNAVYGFVNMLNKIMAEYEPEYIAVAFDRKEPTFRHLEYSEYKAGRRKAPFELIQQFPILKDLLSRMDVTCLELAGFEADDIIGTLVKRGEAAGLEPYVITGDKDALQLASEVTRVIITRKGLTEFDVYDKDAMMERYHMTPEQFIDLKGLMGDSSDNIPGIPGVGEKTGIALIEQFGSVEEMLAHTDQISKPKLREKVEENAALARLSRKLAEINTNVPLETDFESMRILHPDVNRVTALYRDLELFSLIGKLDKTWLGDFREGPEGEAAGESASGEELTVLLEGRDDVSAVQKELGEADTVFLKTFGDPDHVGQPALYGMALGLGDKLYYLTDSGTMKDAMKILGEGRIGIRGHLLKDSYYLMKSLAGEELKLNTAFDSGIAQYVLEPQRSDFGYKALSIMYAGREMEDEKDFLKNNSQTDLFGNSDSSFAAYAAECLQLLRLVEPVQRGDLKDKGLEEVYYDIELPLIEIFSDMEYRGFRTDRGELKRIGGILEENLQGMQERIYELAGEEFNINSPKQLGTILFEKLNMPGAKKTKTGYSTNVDVLEKLRDDYEIAGLVLEYRTLTKLRSTYVEGLLPLISPKDGKIRAHFQQTGTATGRISCTEPNLQNIPVRQELGRNLRRAFVADEGRILVDADYSQIELRILAHISGDENMIAAFRNGEDIHRSTAARVFEVPESEVTSIQRSNAKAVNFGVIYGMSGFGLSENLNITRRQAEKYISDYFEKYKAVREYMDRTIEECREKGYVTTIKGRRREIVDIRNSNFMKRQMGERLAMNSPIQGSAADIIKIAMIKVFRELRDRGFQSKMILQVHDELIIDTVLEEKEAVMELLKRNMMGADELKVPLEVGMDSGNNWYEVK
ncbi:MAG: DNA polymerase I [Firmicutes bacterium]|nr:DNA polymerase I [Bacillota bacterium]